MKKYLTPLALAMAVACTGSPGTDAPMGHNTTPKTTTAPKHIHHQHGRPSRHADVAYTTYTVYTHRAQSLRTATGSTLHIPAGAWADSLGRPVQGKVALRYREVHSPMAIVLSGLPMVYDSAGVKGRFVSGGMVEVYASQQGQELQLAKGKTLQLDMAGWQEDTDYNYYYLDPHTQQWQYLQAAPAPRPMPGAAAHPRRLAQAQLHTLAAPTAPTPPLPGEPLLKLDLPHLPEYADTEWRYMGKDPNLNPALKPYLLQNNWKKIDLQKTQPYLYTLVLQDGATRHEIPLQPVLRGQDLVAAQRDFDQYLATKKEAQKQLARSVRKAEKADTKPRVLRTLPIARMGAYNLDKLYKMANTQLVTLAVTTPAGTDLAAYRLYYLNSYLNTALEVKPGETIPLMDQLQQPYICLLGIAPGGQMLYMGAEDLGSVDLQKAMREKRIHLALRTAPQGLADRPQDFLAAMPGSLREELEWL